MPNPDASHVADSCGNTEHAHLGLAHRVIDILDLRLKTFPKKTSELLSKKARTKQLLHFEWTVLPAFTGRVASSKSLHAEEVHALL